MLPWQPKHHTVSDFTNMAYSKKRAYSKQTISFQHDRIWIILNIFYTIYICNTNKKILVFKILDNSYHGNKNCQKWVHSVAKKYYVKWILPKEKCEIDTFQTGFVIQVILITLTTRSVYGPTLVVHKILVKNVKHAICIMFPSNKRVTMETNFQNSKNWPFSNVNNFFCSKAVYERHI